MPQVSEQGALWVGEGLMIDRFGRLLEWFRGHWQLCDPKKSCLASAGTYPLLIGGKCTHWETPAGSIIRQHAEYWDVLTDADSHTASAADEDDGDDDEDDGETCWRCNGDGEIECDECGHIRECEECGGEGVL